MPENMLSGYSLLQVLYFYISLVGSEEVNLGRSANRVHLSSKIAQLTPSLAKDSSPELIEKLRTPQCVCSCLTMIGTLRFTLSAQSNLRITSQKQIRLPCARNKRRSGRGIRTPSKCPWNHLSYWFLKNQLQVYLRSAESLLISTNYFEQFLGCIFLDDLQGLFSFK